MKPSPCEPRQAGRMDHSALADPPSDSPDQEDGYTCRCRVFTGPRCPLCGLPALRDNEPHAPLRLDLTYWPIWREP